MAAWGGDADFIGWTPKPAIRKEPSLSEALAACRGSDRKLDLAMERLLNSSSIHDDHLDRFPDDAESFTSDSGVMDRWPSKGLSKLRGWAFIAMVLDEEAGKWRVVLRDPSGGHHGGEHGSLALAKCLAAVAGLLPEAAAEGEGPDLSDPPFLVPSDIDDDELARRLSDTLRHPWD